MHSFRTTVRFLQFLCVFTSNHILCFYKSEDINAYTHKIIKNSLRIHSISNLPRQLSFQQERKHRMLLKESFIEKEMLFFLKSNPGYTDISGDGGCLKKVLKDGSKTSGKPAEGQIVKVHYTINILGEGLQQQKLDSSLDRNEPLSFILGQTPSDVILGWDMAIKTMEQGELSHILCSPSYAYGENGVPPKIPENAILCCEVELLSWLDLDKSYGTYKDENDLMDDWKEDIATGKINLDEDLDLPDQVSKFKKAEDEVKIVDVDDPTYIDMQQKVYGKGDGYTWIENPKLLIMKVPVSRTLKSKDISIGFKRKFLSVLIPKQGVALEGDLEGIIDPANSYWYIDDDSQEGKANLEVFLQKKSPIRIWGCIFRKEITVEYVD